jgi:hypothetical protein
VNRVKGMEELIRIRKAAKEINNLRGLPFFAV